MLQSCKLFYKWLSPYKVQKAIPKKGTYLLEELDGTQLAGTYSSNRLKKFIKQSRFYVPVSTDPNNEGSNSSESEDGLEEPESEATVCKSAPIQEKAWVRQQADLLLELQVPGPIQPTEKAGEASYSP